MIKSKPVLILRNFSQKEFRDFEKFLSAELFPSWMYLQQLIKIIRPYFPALDAPALEKKKVFRKLFPEDAFDENKMRHVLSDFAKALEEFIAYRELHADPIRKKLLLLDYYRRNGPEKYYIQIYEDTLKMQQKAPIKDALWFFNQYQLEEKAYIHSQHQKSRSLDSNLQTLSDYLDLFYITNKLKHSGEMLTREMLLKVSYQKPFLQEVVHHVRDASFSNYPAVSVYHLIVLMHLEPGDDSHYRNLLLLLDQNKETFTREELVDMYVFAQNYCTHQINSGRPEYLREIFALYKKMIELDAIFENGFVRPHVFKNIVTVGIRLDEYVWVEEFIGQYKDKLDPRHREHAVNYNMAWLFYARKEYKKALRHLAHAEMMDVFYQLGARCLQLKIYYETMEEISFYALTDSFYVYLRRNEQIADFQKNAHLLFVKMIKRLMRIRLDRDKKAAMALREELVSTKDLLDLSWFMKKLDEI